MGCKDIGIQKSAFEEKAQSLSLEGDNSFRALCLKSCVFAYCAALKPVIKASRLLEITHTVKSGSFQEQGLHLTS